MSPDKFWVIRWMDKILHDPQHDKHVIVSSRAPRTPLISTLPEWVGDAGFRSFAHMPLLSVARRPILRFRFGRDD